MDNRDDIKVGDVFLLMETVHWYWGLHSKKFMLPHKVIKVTSKQFVLSNGKRFWKKNRKVVGRDYYFAYYPTENAVDQSKEYKAFLEKQKLCNEVGTLMRNLEIPPNTIKTVQELQELKTILISFKDAKAE